jgi:transcriptional regulator with XRE-family HTH domain
MATEELQIKIGQTIKKLRLDNNWTQEEVARQLYLCRDAYGDIERGKTDICLSRLTQIANLYSVEVTFLFGISSCITNNNQYQGRAKKQNPQINHHCHFYSAEENLQHELEKQQLTVELKDKELVMKDREIEKLNKIIELLEKNSVLHEKMV